MDLIRANRVTLVFTNTRFLAEYIFQLLWDANEETLPIGIHHGSLSVEARRKVESAMARGALRALVCTASLDLGWTGAISTLSSRWARPRDPRGCCSGSGGPTTGWTSRAGRCWCRATASSFSKPWQPATR
jgi:hypothetical protein